MANPRRVLRLQQLILETVAQTLQREVFDPRIDGLVSVTRVKLSPDLSQAQIGWSCLGSEADRRTCERGLEAASNLIQRRVAESLTTRVTPHISFRFDHSLERAQALEEVFEQLRRERGEQGEADPEGSETPDEPSAGGDAPA